MVSLFIESHCNELKTERNLELNSNIKKLIQILILPQVFNFYKIKNIKDNIFFKEKNTDIVHTLSNTENTINVLTNQYYDKTSMDEYNTCGYNYCELSETKDYFKNIKSDYITELNINAKGHEIQMSWFIDDNFIVFYGLAGESEKYFYHFNESLIIKDFKIDKDNFCHILYETNLNTYYAKSHMFLPFAKLNTSNQFFNEEYLLENIKLNVTANEIIKRDSDKLYCYDSEYNPIIYYLSKRYFFEFNGLIYFNHSDIYDFLKGAIIDKYIQLNNINLYNYLSLLGLNEFKTKRNMKISSLELNMFNKVFRNRFNNTLNGGINFFDAKNIDLDKDYKVNINDEYFSINGNFIADTKGLFAIKIIDDICYLYRVHENNEELIDSIKIYSNTFYFHNLKFFYKRFDKLKDKYVFQVSNLSPYPFYIKKSKTKVSGIYNDEKVSNILLSKLKTSGFENSKIKVAFNGKSIVVENLYDFNTKQYLFDNHKINVKTNERFKISDKADFKFYGPYIIKDGFIYFRSDGILTYTTMKEFQFQLINELGFITDFWVENQNKNIYIKISDNKVQLVSNSNDCDIFCKIPPIKDFIVKKNKFSNITIDDNNDYESEWDEDKGILITDKFLNVPLFSMIYIENVDEVEIFTVDKKKITNVITQPYNGGLIAYFDALDELYYYNTKEREFNYFEPLKAYQNITNTYYIDENNEINFGGIKKIENFSMSCNKPIGDYEIISLILYNHEKGETHKIQLSANELEKVFELNLEVDSLFMERNPNFKDIKFSFNITKINSIIQNGKITFLKSNISNPVFSSKLQKEDIVVDDFSKLKINTKYEKMSNGSLKESYLGDIVIRNPFEFEIPIFKQNNFQYYFGDIDYCISTQNDDFYLENFKTPGLLFKILSEENKIRTSNDIFTVDEIIDKEQISKEATKK